MRIFPRVATAIFLTFMSLMVIVTITSYARRSGHTGLDMSKIQQLRTGLAEVEELFPIKKAEQDLMIHRQDSDSTGKQ